MSRPTNKITLIQLSNENYQKLLSFIKSLSPTQQQTPFASSCLNRNIRDVLGHLHHWHMLFLEWYKVGMAGEKPEMPAKGYNWQTTPELNKYIQAKYKKTELHEIMQMLDASFEDVQKIINTHTNEELFEKKKYAWTGTTSLGAYLVSATSSHYDWAIKLIKKQLK